MAFAGGLAKPWKSDVAVKFAYTIEGDMPEEIQRRFRRWMTAPADRETKDAALFQAWKELLARPAERDYRH